jgi:hypothetical protein
MGSDGRRTVEREDRGTVELATAMMAIPFLRGGIVNGWLRRRAPFVGAEGKQNQALRI